MTENTVSLLDGTVKQVPEIPSKQVRVFLSSTFTDTALERNLLMERVYPKLRKYCKETYDVEFQVVDMRWGVTSDVQNDHLTSEICLKEITNCQQLSAGPCFVTLIGQKYGVRPFPSMIEETEFEKLRESVKDEENASILDMWFKKDENRADKQYILQPIGTVLNKDNKEEDKAKLQSEWWMYFDQICLLLRKAATICHQESQITEQTRDKYFVSVTETEIQQGILDYNDRDDRCFCFIRNIVDLADHLSHIKARRFTDVRDEQAEFDEEASMLINKLKAEKIKRMLPSENVIELSVKWCEDGGMHLEVHKEYFDNFCQLFYEKMVSLIERNFTKHSAVRQNALLSEVIQHLNMKQLWTQNFQGREKTLHQIEKYVVGIGKQDESLMVLYGPSGCGKTAVIAKCAENAHSWLHGKNAVVVIRFLGTSPMSSNVHMMLNSICQQLNRIYDNPEKEIPQDFTKLIQYFHSCLTLSSAKRPLVIFLDSLDQLSQELGAHKLLWLPRNLPVFTRIVVSAFVDVHNLLSRLQNIIPKQDHFVELLALEQDVGLSVIMSKLESTQKILTADQRNIIDKIVEECAMPLYLQLMFDEIYQWHSYTSVNISDLAQSTEAAVNHLFNKLESQHGSILVKHSLSYLTVAKNGLSEVELEDILSLDDDVLNSIFVFWLPPFRRLPSFLWSRLKNDLGRYVVERNADNTQVLSWYHRQFWEAVEGRYLNDADFKKNIYKNCAEYFLGTWGDGAKKPFKFLPFLMKRQLLNDPNSEADRMVPTQATFSSQDGKEQFNLRKLSELPPFLIHADLEFLLKKEIVFNYDWLYAKLKAFSLQETLSDLNAIYTRFKQNGILLVMKALQIGGSTLNILPSNLHLEIVGRLLNHADDDEDIRSLVQQCDSIGCRRNAVTFLNEGFGSPADALTYSLEGHTYQIADLKVMKSGKELLSISWDGYLAVWDLENGEMISRVDLTDIIPGNGSKLFLSKDEKYIVCRGVASKGMVVIMNSETLDIYYIYKYTQNHKRNNHAITMGYKYFCVDNRVIDIHTGKLLHKLSDYVVIPDFVQLAITSDDKMLLVALKHHTNIYDMHTCKELLRLPTDHIASSLIVTHDDNLAFIGQIMDCKIRVYSLNQSDEEYGKEITLLDVHASFPHEKFDVDDDYVREVSLMSAYHQHNILLTVIKRHYIVLWPLQKFDTTPILMNTPRKDSEIGLRFYYGAVLSSDGRYVISSEGKSPYLAVWCSKTGDMLVRYQTQSNDIHRTVVRNIADSTHSDQIVTVAYGDIGIKVWELSKLIDKGLKSSTEGYSSPVRSIVVNEKNSLALVRYSFAMNSSESYHYVNHFGLDCWSVLTGEKKAVFPFEGYGQVQCTSLSKDCSVLALSLGNLLQRYITVINLTNHKLLCTIDLPYCDELFISDDGCALVALTKGGPTNNTYIYDTNTGVEMFSKEKAIGGGFISDRNTVVLHDSNQIDIFDVKTNNTFSTRLDKIKIAVSCQVLPLSFQVLICGDENDNSLTGFIFNVSSDAVELYGNPLEHIHNSGICAVSDDGIFGIDKTLQVYDLKNSHFLKKLNGTNTSKEIKLVMLSHKGKYAVWVDREPLDCIKVATIEKNMVVAQCSLHDVPASLVLLPQFDMLLCGSNNGHMYTLLIRDHDVRAWKTVDDRTDMLLGKHKAVQLDKVLTLPLSESLREKMIEKKSEMAVMNFSLTLSKRDSTVSPTSKSSFCYLI